MSQELIHLGLADRRALKEYQDKVLPGWIEKIYEAAGCKPTLTMDWNSIAIPGEGPRYKEDFFWELVFFEPLVRALKAVAIDEMGKEALQSGLKEIRFRFDDATAPASNYPAGVTYRAGVLEINWRPATNAHDVDSRAEALQKVLEANL